MKITSSLRSCRDAAGSNRKYSFSDPRSSRSSPKSPASGGAARPRGTPQGVLPAETRAAAESPRSEVYCSAASANNIQQSLPRCGGLFSAVSKPIFATKYSFFSMLNYS